jgi:DNA-binding transcriptional ArsR family regulator
MADRRARADPTTDDDLGAEELAVLLKALAHPARIRLLQHLARHGTCYFGNLSDVVELAPSTTSQHVKVLKDAGLVLGSAEEQRTCYCVNADRLALLKRLVKALRVPKLCPLIRPSTKYEGVLR